jgi:hypothetical protein
VAAVLAVEGATAAAPALASGEGGVALLAIAVVLLCLAAALLAVADLLCLTVALLAVADLLCLAAILLAVLGCLLCLLLLHCSRDCCWSLFSDEIAAVCYINCLLIATHSLLTTEIAIH